MAHKGHNSVVGGWRGRGHSLKLAVLVARKQPLGRLRPVVLHILLFHRRFQHLLAFEGVFNGSLMVMQFPRPAHTDVILFQLPASGVSETMISPRLRRPAWRCGSGIDTLIGPMYSVQAMQTRESSPCSYQYSDQRT